MREPGAMRIFVAGGTGAVGRYLVPKLVHAGHDVVALARSSDKGRVLDRAGARPVVADAFDREALRRAIVDAEPEVVIHQLTALSRPIDFKTFDDDFALTNRLRTETLDTMLDAAREVGARRFIAQSFCGWPFARSGGPMKTERDPLDPDPPPTFRDTLEAIRHLESAVGGGAAGWGAGPPRGDPAAGPPRGDPAARPQGIALRYGFLYGPGTAIASDGEITRMVRKRRLPIVGKGTGIWSFVHVEDAAAVTVAAALRGEPGIYNVVDDEPAAVSEWLPHLAEVVGARRPIRVPAWLGRLAIGEGGVSMMTRVRGGSNAKAKEAFGWTLAYSSWRQGFADGLA